MNISVSEVLKRKNRIINYDGKSNFHTHSFYCDGKDAPGEMLERAIELGFTDLGFSGHQYSDQDADYAMSFENESKYRKEVLSLREEFKDRINIYLGIERDYCCENTSGYHYIIGSTHHVMVDGSWMDVDYSAEVMKEGVNDFFSGDYMAYAEAYYRQETDVLEKTRGQIVGHFDLITVFNKDNRYFNEDDSYYRRLAIKSAERIVEQFVNNKRFKELPEGFPPELGEIIEKTECPIFEINTGAWAKGRRDYPYPAPFIIDYLSGLGVPMLLNSDCHNKDLLDFGFSEVLGI